MNNKIEALESFLESKEYLLMDHCIKSQFIVSENDVLAKHYSLIDPEIEKYHDNIVSTQWTIDGVSGRFDLVVVNKWVRKYSFMKDCYKEQLPYYAVEYKIDDSTTKYGKGHQVQDFAKDVVRLSEKCTYLQRAFALFYYRGPIRFSGNEFDEKSPNYLFKNNKIKNKDKLNAYFVDRLGIHRLNLPQNRYDYPALKYCHRKGGGQMNTIAESTKILSEQDVLQRLEQDSERGFAYVMVWERVLEHVRNGEIITFDYKTQELHWYNGLSHA